MRQVGFIGLGNIGAPMAERLHTGGFALTACDRDGRALDRFRALGVAITSDPAGCARADMVVLMVATDTQAREVALGLVDTIDPARPPMVAIMSTVLPDTVREIDTTLGPAGIRLIDAPVSGGAVRARDGALTIMVGGSAADLAAMRPVLDRLGTTVHHCGPLGSGALTKILNNLVGVTTHYLLAETMGLAQRFGMAPGDLAAIMEGSSGRTSGTRDWAATREVYRSNAASFDSMKALAAVTRKDLAHAVALARRAGVATPLLDAVAQAHGETPVESLFDMLRTLANETDR